jgi:hypothetical protein
VVTPEIRLNTAGIPDETLMVEDKAYKVLNVSSGFVPFTVRH